MKLKDNQNVLYLVYSLIIGGIFLFLVFLGNFQSFQDFILNVEQNSFDMRQQIASKYKKPNKDIVILAIDDATYEYIMDKYGSWPVSRQIWADVINSIEKVKPRLLIFDLLFIKPNLNDIEADKALVNAVKNNAENVFLSMNFDNYSSEVRKSPNLSTKFKLKVKTGNLEDNEYITYSNARVLMDELSIAAKNLGAVNVTRDNDGTIRSVAPIFKYKGTYYPNLSLIAAMKLLDADDVTIKNNKIILNTPNKRKKIKIPLDATSRAAMNWYGGAETYKYVPLWEVIKAKNANNLSFLNTNFKDKIVLIGTTATSLADIKSVPTSSSIPGVELHATYLNNILDNNFIKKTSLKVDFVVAILLSLLIGYYVLKTDSVVKTFLALFLILVFYGFYSLLVMLMFKLWVSVVFTYLTVVATFVLIYCEKYLLKTKDYEQTYKLAVTDGLTQLYNHRYFQEQMLLYTGNYRRYGTVFSIILLDIDFFKKFNDTYGHQSGDCVLKQVAAILKKNSRPTDIACRYGGEEMTLILTNTDKKGAVIAAHKICKAVRENKFILANGEKVNVTVSVGVATSVANCFMPQELIEYADKCLYKAKENGRNQVVYKPN